METPVPRHPFINIVTNVNRRTKPKSVFHSDTPYTAQQPSIFGLMAIGVPEAGGATIFANQYVALDPIDSDPR